MLFLHVCCAGCLLNYLASLKKENFSERLILYFGNNNIHPKLEYQARLKAVQQVMEKFSLIYEFKSKLIIDNYRPQDYFDYIKKRLPKDQIWDERRCQLCWQMRLTNTYQFALVNQADRFSTTLLVSRFQSKDQIIKIGQELEKKNSQKIKFFFPEKIISDQKFVGFYQQNYCGCCFSLTSKAIGKFF